MKEENEKVWERKKDRNKRKSNDIIAGNGRVLKFKLFILWLYLFKKI